MLVLCKSIDVYSLVTLFTLAISLIVEAQFLDF